MLKSTMRVLTVIALLCRVHGLREIPDGHEQCVRAGAHRGDAHSRSIALSTTGLPLAATTG